MSFSAQAALIRQQSERWLTDLCTIRKFQGYSVQDGEYTELFTELEDVPCRVINRSGRLQTNFQGQSEEVQLQVSRASLRFQLPFDTTLTMQDKIAYSGISFDLVDIPLKHSLMGAFVVEVERSQ